MKFAAAAILGLTVTTTASVLSRRAANCNRKGDETLTVKNWNKIKADDSILAWWHGGTDAEGVRWPGADRYAKTDKTPKRFTTMLGSRLVNQKADDWSCSAFPSDDKCETERCTEIGRYDGDGKMVSEPSEWGFLALHSVVNLHRWLSDIWEGVDIGQSGANSVVFSAAKDRPGAKLNVGLKTALAGASAVLGVLGAIPGVPVAGAANLANPVVGGVAAVLGIHLPSQSDDTSFETADTFSQAIEAYTEQTRVGLIAGNREILDSETDLMPHILADGAWVNPPKFTNGDPIVVTDIGDFYKRNMIARGINALWRQWNVYVYYVWLDDAGAKPGDKGTKCDLDRSGPQNSKYCADDGVYYLYLYRKSVGEDGGAGEPYGLGKLAAEPYNINPINYGILGARNIDDFLTSPERLEGTWTLPVCDGSSRGRFNVDYMTNKKYSMVGGRGEPPCACGIDGRDTAAFVEAAHLEADKVAGRCLLSWAESGLEDWPPGIERIEYDTEGKHFVTRKEVEACMMLRHTRGSVNPGCTKSS
ncbi:MAG: hypothetical protein Q9169_005199 [Polycauliona sp. 2 TL-2023]